jgi:hypothetical protein
MGRYGAFGGELPQRVAVNAEVFGCLAGVEPVANLRVVVDREPRDNGRRNTLGDVFDDRIERRWSLSRLERSCEREG